MDYARVNGKPGFNIRNPNTGKVEFVSIESLEKQGKKDQFLKDLEKNTGKGFRQWEDSWIQRRGQAQLEKDTAAIAAAKENQNRNRWFITKAAGGKAAFDAGGGSKALKDNPNLTAADIQRRGMSAIRARQAQTSSSSSQPPASQPSASSTQQTRPAASTQQTRPAASAQTGDRTKDLTTWALANKNMINKVGTKSQREILTRAQAGQTMPEPRPISKDIEDIKNIRNPQSTLGAPSSSTSTSSSPIQAPKPASSAPAPKVKLPVVPFKDSYEYDAYDLVLEYLLSQGHAGTLEEANYVMLEMNAEMIGDIVEVMTTVQSVPIPIVPVKKGTKGGDGSNPPSHGEYKREYNPEVDEPKLPPTKKK